MSGDTLDRAAALLREARRIGCVGHVGPDGDALGSALGIALAARRSGKEAFVSFGEPAVIPHEFRFLDLAPVVGAAEFPEALDVVVVCDTAVESRLGSIAPKVATARTRVVLDHHVPDDPYGDVRLIDPTAAATAQLAYYLLEALGWPIDAAVATALYTGIVTDTGRFQYSNTTPEVHRVAGELIAAGAEPATVGQHVYEESRFGYLKVVGEVMGRARLVPEARLVWSIVYQADLDAAGVGYEDTDGLIDILRVAEEADVACLLKRLDKRFTKGSLRSRGRVSVRELAAAFGGGGHHNAAGFTWEGEPEEVIDAIVAALS